MGALRRVDSVVFQRDFGNDTRCRDLRPPDGNAQPRVARTPSARTDEHVALAFVEELAIETLDFIGYQLVVGGGKIVACLHINHIANILHRTVTERVVGTHQALLVGNRREVFLEHLLRIDNRTNLQKIERCLVAFKIARKLDFNRSAHRLNTIFHRHLEQFGQRHHTVFQHAVERDDLATVAINAVAQNFVGNVVGRGNSRQRTVVFGLFHLEFQNIKALIDLEITTRVHHVKRIEMGLCLLQGEFQFTRLQDLLRMVGRHAQRLTAIDDVFSESERKVGNALLGLLVADGIVVERAQNAAEGRIVAVAVLQTGHFLQNHGHFFLVDDVRRGGHIGLRIAVEHRRIDALDGGFEHIEHLVFVGKPRNHISGINACKWLIMSIFEQRTRPHGDG